MLFHWFKDYGKRRLGATVVVDRIFEAAYAASPDVFAGDSRKEPVQQAKFEHMVPWLALALLETSEREGRGILEAMVDRIEVGLREGGVGDMKVGKHVRKYAAALHGRVRRYASLMAREEWAELERALAEHGVAPQLAATLEAAQKEKSVKNAV